MDGILTLVKKSIGIEKEYTHFDTSIIIHINSVFMFLNQLGVGPVDCFMIEDDSETWIDFLGDRKDLEAVKSYMYIKVRLIFDPPSTSFLLDALKKEVEEFEWRLNAQAERTISEGGVVGG